MYHHINRLQLKKRYLNYFNLLPMISEDMLLLFKNVTPINIFLQALRLRIILIQITSF